VDFIRTQNNTYAGYKENGSFFFGTNSALSSGDGLADLMLGALSEYDQSRPQQTAYRESIPGFYGQDTIKLNSRLTFNIGLRWEPMLYATDYFERGSQFSMAAFLAAPTARSIPTGRPGCSTMATRGSQAFTNNNGELLAARGPRGQSSRRRTGHHPRGIGILYNTPEAWFFQRLASNPPVANEIDLTGTQAGTFSKPLRTIGRQSVPRPGARRPRT